MGILGLSKLISEVSPSAVTSANYDSYFEKIIAVDASLYIYQFLVAVRSDGDHLKSQDGETTSHLLGLFQTSVRLLENGLRPVYVFDGRPPDMKAAKLGRRAELRSRARERMEMARERNDSAAVEKYNRQLVRVSGKHVAECKKLLRLMGIPWVGAPGEAEAQCAALTRAGKAFAAATEDMDALAFGARVLLRRAIGRGKAPLQEYRLESVLEGLGLNQSQLVDLAILLGCDYCDTIRGIGAKRAMRLIRRHGDMEAVLANLEGRFRAPDGWPYQKARALFTSPEVVDFHNLEFRWTQPYEEGLVRFLCAEKQFSETRVRNGVRRMTRVAGGARPS